MEYRQWIFEQAGGKCVRCDWSDWRGLQLDHVNSDGHSEKRSHSPTTLRAAEKILARIFAGELQVLCANHNWVKRYELNEHVPADRRAMLPTL